MKEAVFVFSYQGNLKSIVTRGSSWIINASTVDVMASSLPIVFAEVQWRDTDKAESDEGTCIPLEAGG